MARRHVWETAATAALLLAFLVAGVGLHHLWQLRALDAALARAIEKYDHKAVERLLSKGARISARSSRGGTVLTVAARYGRLGLLKQGLAHGLNVNARTRNGYTPLIRAVEEGQRAAVVELLAHGADLTPRTSRGDTALGMAQRRRDRAIIRLLRDAGAKE
jgi:ankyrin repeat protein